MHDLLVSIYLDIMNIQGDVSPDRSRADAAIGRSWRGMGERCMREGPRTATAATACSKYRKR
eukprot:COSAG01_NODE_2380_length_7793_cov_118.038602_4_plen_62_part_00